MSGVMAVFGLGEAGSLIAADLAAAGIEVRGFDPAPVATPAGVSRLPDPRQAVSGADFVLGITAAADATRALEQALDAIDPGSIYADLATAAPALKKSLAARAAGRGLAFVDVALLSTVPGKGLRTPAGLSGDGADAFARTFSALGMPVEKLGEEAGDAACRKLLRSVMMKGLAALLIEAMRAGHAAGVGDWLWRNMSEQLRQADEALLARLVNGTKPHAVRRLHEMCAAGELLDALGVEPVMTRATIETLQRMADETLPDIPDPPVA